MNRKSEPIGIGDFILKDLDIDLSEITATIEDEKKLSRFSPFLRLNMTPKEAFKLLLRYYIREVQTRHRQFISDDNTLRVICEVSTHMTLEVPKPGLMLCVNQGNGKTTLAHALVAAVQSLKGTDQIGSIKDYSYIESRSITATEICNYHKEQNYDGLRYVKNIPILIVDDLGEEPKEILVYGTPVYPIRELLESRYDALRFTILTTNLTTEDLPDHYGWRLVDRFREFYFSVAHSGPSYR